MDTFVKSLLLSFFLLPVATQAQDKTKNTSELLSRFNIPQERANQVKNLIAIEKAKLSVEPKEAKIGRKGGSTSSTGTNQPTSPSPSQPVPSQPVPASNPNTTTTPQPSNGQVVISAPVNTTSSKEAQKARRRELKAKMKELKNQEKELRRQEREERKAEHLKNHANGKSEKNKHEIERDED